MKQPKKKERDLFTVKWQKPKALSKKKKKSSKSAGKKKKEEENEKSPKRFEKPPEFETLNYQILPEGQKILGCISEIHKYEMIVSLPNRMHGTVPITNISKSYTQLLSKLSQELSVSEPIHTLDELYSVGDMLITKVKSISTSATGRIKVILSILPEDVNSDLRAAILAKGVVVQCAVASKEENGYIMDVGMRNIRAVFLPLKFAPKGVVEVGKVLLCVVQLVLDRKTSSEVRLNVSTQPEHFSDALALDEESNMAVLSPGTLVQAVIEKVLSVGLQLTVGSWTGVVGLEHLTHPEDSLGLYQEGQSVPATVLYVTNVTSVVHCSLNERICRKSIGESCNALKLGDVVENAKVYKASKQGVHLSLPNQCHGFCSVNKLRDKPYAPGEVAKRFPVGSKKTCRVIYTSFMDQLFIVALKKSILSEQVVGRADAEVGQKMKCTISEHNNAGLIVSLSKHVKAFVPNRHLIYSNIKNLESKYPLGSTVFGRILKNIPGEDPHMTLRTDLVNMTYPVVKSVLESNVGVMTQGCVAQVYRHGLLVELFGGCCAFVPLARIPLGPGDSLMEIFQIGSIVKCRVLSVDAPNDRMMAELLIGKAEEEGPVKLKLKEVVRGVVTSVEEDQLVVSIDGMREAASIPWYHLSDDVQLSRSLFPLVRAGDLVKNAVVFSNINSEIVLSLKPTIFQSKSLSKEENSVTKKEIFPSVVTEIEEEKMKVVAPIKFGSSFFINKKYVVTQLPSDYTIPSLGIHVGQTIFAQSTRKGDKMFALNTCLRNVMTNKEESSFQCLYNALVTRRLFQTALRNLEGESPFSKVKVGKKYNGRVVSLSKQGALVHVPFLHLDGVIHSQHCETKLKPKQKLKIRVLCVNYEEKCLELSTRSFIKRLCSTRDHQIKVGDEYSCQVVLPKRDFILGRLKARGGQVVYLPSKRHWNDFKGRNSFYEIGKNYKVKVKYVEEELVLADFIHHNSGNSKPLKMITNTPSLKIQHSIPVSSLGRLTLNIGSLTKADLRTKARQRVVNVTQFLDVKNKLKEEKQSGKSKRVLLKEDSFPQIDHDFYWDWVMRNRMERKKLKKTGGKTTNAKRKREEKQQEEKESEEPTKKKLKKDKLKSKSNKKASQKINGEMTEETEIKCKVNGEEEINEESMEEEEIREEPKAKHKKTSNDTAANSLLDDYSCLEVQSGGFDWSGQMLSEPQEEASSSDEDDAKIKQQKTLKRLKKFESKSKARTDEGKTRELELQRLDPDRLPETALDFEEKIEKSPNSSSVWIEYASFYLENAETEKAKSVISKALGVIPATMEDERLALWNVLLRLEVMYGTVDSVQGALKEAVATNDELKVFYIMIDVYVSASKIKEAESIVKQMTKKFSQDKDVWVRAGLFYFKAKELKSARSLLDRSLLSLPQEDHLDVINRFAQFELKFGEAERGRTIFEKILSNFPKRLDLWNVYVDILIKEKNIKEARDVLERMAGLKLRLKAMRSVFKKLLEFEKQFGTPATVEAVKSRVEDYVTAALKDKE